ncbi:hypothetical protein Tco_0771076 [Tanacetum coccineum]|uniref:Transposase n=1 Tax=Tanacetum coccineum TaxID=301880 RepID=A0ABQ4ZEA1_9ASTR
MRLNELQQFSDGTFDKIMKSWTKWSKDFHSVQVQNGMETRSGQRKTRKSIDFITVIEKRLLIKGSYRSPRKPEIKDEKEMKFPVPEMSSK